MLVLGMSAADISVVLGQAFVGGIVLSLPFAAAVAAGQGVTAAAARARGRARARRRAGVWRRAAHAGDGRGPEPRAGVRHGRRERTPERPGQDALYAAQLRRAAPIVRLFAAASPGGEKEAAYHALVRLAAAIEAARGPSCGGAPVTPGVLYRDLTRGGPWTVSGADALAFDARVCAELDRRGASEMNRGGSRG